MSILNRIEAEIGSVPNWPQDILRGLFYIRRPTPFMVIAIIKFLFGNKISLDDTLELFDVYSKQSLQYEDLVHLEDLEHEREIISDGHLLQYENRSYGLHKRI